jgi:hypothetical protein
MDAENNDPAGRAAPTGPDSISKLDSAVSNTPENANQAGNGGRSPFFLFDDCESVRRYLRRIGALMRDMDRADVREKPQRLQVLQHRRRD